MEAPMTDPAPLIVPINSPSIHRGRLWALTLVGAIVAGGGAWAAGEATLNRFVPAERMVMVMGTKTNIPSFDETVKAQRRNASLANGILGGLLGLAMGLAGGLARGSLRAASIAGIVGTLLGLGAGVGASEAALPIYFQQLDKAQEEMAKDVLFPLLIHGACWSLLGAVAGGSLAFGAGGDRSKIVGAAVAGLVGAVLGAVVYEMIGAMAFPSDRTTEPIAAHWVPRLAAKLSVSLLASGFAAFALLSPARAARKTG